MGGDHLRPAFRILAEWRESSFYCVRIQDDFGSSFTFRFAENGKITRSVLDSIRHKSDDGWRVIACEVNWEDENLCDDHTGEKIESAYGENENE